ncbi:MAG: hypothetical protein MJ244_00060 [Clostridia bacterium]|nr:hypothetical protein [Clostridia bacterium]
MDIKNNEGNLSIEGALVFPVFALVLLTFNYVMYYISLSDNISKEIAFNIIENNSSSYKEYIYNLPYTFKKLEHKNYKRLSNMEDDYQISGDKLNYNINYKYDIPLNFIDDYYNEKKIETKLFTHGLSLLDYGINTEYIKNDFDIWSMSNINRAKSISDLTDAFSEFDGSHIDNIYNDQIVSMVSLDFRKDTYSNNHKLIVSKLKNDINELYNFKSGTVNGKNINEDSYKGKIFNLILPTNDYDSLIEKDLMIVKNYAHNKGIQFKVTIIN